MSLDKQFTLEAADKPKTNQPDQQRRQKFVNAIEKQFNSFCNDGSATWVWQSDAGDWFISPRYGKAPLELTPGKNSIKCVSSDDVSESLSKLKALTLEGKLDKTLEVAAAEIRRRFGT